MLGCCVDVGSTYTKVRVLDLDSGELLVRSSAPTTVEEDVMTGLEDALAEAGYDRNEFDVRLASSSAAGGLRMAIVGFSPRYTLEAGTRAALGAGANVVADFTWYLDDEKLAALLDCRPDVVLLTGGTDGGNERALRHNAEKLATLAESYPVIVAGNADVREEAGEVLAGAGHEVSLATNVVDESADGLNVADARDRIRDVFMDHIVDAKGVGRVREFTTTGELMPTPEAVSLASELLSRGAIGDGDPDPPVEGPDDLDPDQGGEQEPGSESVLGDLLTIDVGGATTDAHSVGHGEPTASYVATADDLDEPFRKRTVEGDLGIRYNAPTILERVGVEGVLEAFDGDRAAVDVEAYVRRVHERTEFVPEDDRELRLDAALASVATRLAAERHAGRIERNAATETTSFAAAGEAGEVDVAAERGADDGGQDRLPTKHLQVGKDLTEFRAVVGTGGVLSNNAYAGSILDHARATADDRSVLLPEDPAVYLDRNYVLYACGLLAETHPEAARRVLGRNVEQIEQAP